MTDDQKYQYEKLIAARNFHYENLNKWLSFFYVAMGAIFAGYCTISNKGENIGLEILIIGVLYLVSICAYLSCKGYCYWENNWIMLLHDFEKHYIASEPDRNVRIYSVFANIDKLHAPYNPIGGANVSTTKVSLFLTLSVAILSGAILIYCITKAAGCVCPCCKYYSLFVAFIESGVLTAIVALIGMVLLKSDLKGLDDLKL